MRDGVIRKTLPIAPLTKERLSANQPCMPTHSPQNSFRGINRWHFVYTNQSDIVIRYTQQMTFVRHCGRCDLFYVCVRSATVGKGTPRRRRVPPTRSVAFPLRLSQMKKGQPPSQLPPKYIFSCGILVLENS